MKFFKFLLIAGIGLMILLTGYNTALNAENLAELREKKRTITSRMKEKIEEARDYFDKANKNQDKGDYDKAYEYAEKVKTYVEDVQTLKEELAEIIEKERALLAKKADANKKIKEAKKLIKKAENMDADKWAPELLANAKSSLLSAENSFDDEDFGEALKFANEAVDYANQCINKTQKAIEDDTKKGDLPDTYEGLTIGDGPYWVWKTYTVRLIPERRDCLWRIAEYDYIYGNPWKWPLIFKANMNRIKDEDLIYPGQVFDIPKLDEQGNPMLAPEKGIEEK